MTTMHRHSAILAAIALAVTMPALETTFSEDAATVLANPERGMFRSVEPAYATNTPAGPIRESTLAGWRSAEQHTLVRKYYLLRPWIAQDLPQSVLDEVAQDLAVCRAQGFKLIPRFTYNFNQSFGSDDATEAWTVRHIVQLGAVLRAGAGAIDHVHAGFIGKWGEMHSSSNGHVLPGTTTLSPSGHRIIDALLTHFPQDRMIGLRYPAFKMSMYAEPLPVEQAYDGSRRARLGAYNQGILYDGTDYGTFSTDPVRRAAQRAWWEADCDATFMSGEPAGATPGYTLQDPVPFLAAQRFASLHSNQYDARVDGVYDWWKSNGPAGDSYWDQLVRRLGYRFVLVRASAASPATPGATIRISIAVRNDGFAALHNPRDFRLFLHRAGEVLQLAVSGAPDPRRWRPGTTTTMSVDASIPSDASSGNWELHLTLPDPDPALAADPRFSIRCANLAIWHAGLGSHRLLDLMVTPGGAPVITAPATASPAAVTLP